MNYLSIDIETFSSVDLKACGVYAYTASPDFEILLFAYSLNGRKVEVIDLKSGEEIPCVIELMLRDSDTQKTAYNANFERTCLAQHFKIPMPPEQWKCTAVHATTLGMPPSLGEVARVLGLPEDKQKMNEGKSLIQYFCKPCKPTKTNGNRTRNLPEHDAAKWKIFKEYCKRDVESEMAVLKKLQRFPIPEHEQRLWELDQHINDRGVRIDTVLAKKAIECNDLHMERLTQEATLLTGLDNPKSVSQLKTWILEETGEVVDSLNKDTVPDLLERHSDNDAVGQMLELRQELSKTSIKKYEAMLRSVCPDGRIRGLLQFYGANRTGRWAGRIVQVQNLPKNNLPDLDIARDLVKEGLFDALEILFESTSSTLSQLIRTTFIPSDGHRFIVADFSAIEARVIAWLAGESWRMDVFNTHGKIYEASASQMFRVPIEKISKGNSEYALRAKGKIAELALGYGGSVGALTAMGALDMGLEEEELKPLVNLWRKANHSIVQFWWDAGEAAIDVVKTKKSQTVKGIKFEYGGGILFINLPSGRKLAYIKPQIRLNKYGREGITYEGVDQDTKKWSRIDTYGPKLVENIVQAVARDCLAVAMLRLNARGYKVVMHVHDEVIVEAKDEEGTLEDVCYIMGLPIEWAKGLPLPADGFETKFYKKD